MKQVKDVNEDKPEQWPELRELIDAAALVAIFKNQSADELTYEIPSKAIESLESAIRRFHPKVWEYVEIEREKYLTYIKNKMNAAGGLQAKDLGVVSEKPNPANSVLNKKIGLSKLWDLIGYKKK